MPDQSSSYKEGDTIPWHLLPGIVTVSFFVSLVGTVTTVELLHRRTTKKGWLRWVQLGACSVSMGLIAIWCMHFVGNRAIIMGNGEDELQLYYSPAFTALSVFLPVIFLSLSFAASDMKSYGPRARIASLFGSGTLAGLAIFGMHYSGNIGIANYRVQFTPPSMAGAVIIAIAACLVALILFFLSQELWLNNFWRRCLCAIVLAGAVSGLHWEASWGTSYVLKQVHRGSIGMSRNINLIIAIVLCLLACFVCIALFIITRNRRKRLADRAQQVVLACVTFDPEGKLMVTQDGFLPSQPITRKYNQRSFDDEFNVTHPVFQWIFKVTHNWSSVSDLIAGMRSHLRSVHSRQDGADIPDFRSLYSEKDEEDYSIIFRESFCVAASELANRLHEPLDKIGILYDCIMMTGTNATATERKRRRASLVAGGASTSLDLEAGQVNPGSFGRGQLLFLVRYANNDDANRLLSEGFRFATIGQVGEILAKSMQVPLSELLSQMDRLRTYGPKEVRAPEPGIYLACFALRPMLSKRNWEVLVHKDGPCQLPMVPLSSEGLWPLQWDLFSRMDGCSAGTFLHWLTSKLDYSSYEEKVFCDLLIDRIHSLNRQIGEGFFLQAAFSSLPVQVPISVAGESKVRKISVLAFCIIPDIHTTAVKPTSNLGWMPLSFFKCRQQVYHNAPDHALFARSIHREFAPMITEKHSGATSNGSSKDSTVGLRSQRLMSMFRRPSESKLEPQPEVNCIERNECDSGTDDSSLAGKHPFGGIMVNSEVTVESTTKQGSMSDLYNLGTQGEASVAAMETRSFVDELFDVATAKWQKRS